MISHRPHRICGEFGCGKLTRDKYCEAHEYREEEKRQERNRNYNKYNRDKELHSFYKTKEWRVTSEYVRAKNNYLCIKCEEDNRITKADVTDHIIPITVDYDKRLDIHNLQPLCHACHNIKTAEDKRLYGHS